MVSISAMTSPHAASMQKTDEWLKDLARELGIDDPIRVNRALRATLHTLRDRLTPVEAAHLAAQLPILIRGLFYEGWNPARSPHRMDRAEFLRRIMDQMQPPDYEPEAAARAVFQVLQRHVTGGEIEDIRRMLPRDLDDLWETV